MFKSVECGETYQSHDLPHSPLYVEDFRALYSNQATLGPQLWEEDIRAVHFHDLANLVKAVKQNTVDLVRRNHDILNIAFRVQNQLVELLLCLVYIVLTPPSYVYLILASAVRSGWGVTVYAGEGWREVDGRVRRRFDKPDVLPSPTTDNGMQRQFEFHDVDSTFQLYRPSATTTHRYVEVTYNLINHDEDPGLRMF